MRRYLGAVVVAGLVTACAPARAAPPPVPVLVGAQPPAAVADDDTVAEPDEPPANPGADAMPAVVRAPDSPAPDLDLAGLERVRLDLDELTARAASPVDDAPVPVDDAPAPSVPVDDVSVSALASGTGWAAFDQSLERSIIANGSPTVSVAVVVDGELVRAAGLGVRDPGTADPADAQTRIRVASISKIMTAVALLQLVEEGFVGLDEPIGARLAAGLGIDAVSPGVAALTPEHLLSHTSGLGSFRNSFFSDRQLTCAEAGARAVAGHAAPGSGMSYSNMNYCLAHLLIEELTGQSYTDAVYLRLLTPLGITGPRLAGTYDAGPDEAVHFSRPGRNYMESLGGSGGWIASAADIARIVASLDPNHDGWRPLGDEMLERMRRPPLGRASGGYGLGLILYPDGSVGHTGTLESTHAMVVSRPDGVTWAVLVNGEYPRQSGNLRSMVDRALAAGFPNG